MSEKEIIDFGGTLENPKCPDCGKKLENDFYYQSSHNFLHYDLYGTCPESKKRWHLTFISDDRAISASYSRKENFYDVIEAKIRGTFLGTVAVMLAISILFVLSMKFLVW